MGNAMRGVRWTCWLLFVGSLTAAGAEEPFSGWRGNRTGLWPEATPPVEWSRIPHGSLERDWPIPAQETLAYAPPIADGNRLYLRGERYLYCIGEK